MFSIRSEQLDALCEAAQETTFSDVVRWAERTHPGRFAGRRASETYDLIQRCVATATGYGIDESEAINQFVGLVFDFGEGFEHRPEYRGLGRILAKRDVPGGVRVHIVRVLVAGDSSSAAGVAG